MKELPANVHLLTLEYLTEETLLLRLEHLFEVGESMSQPVTVSLAVSYHFIHTLTLLSSLYFNNMFLFNTYFSMTLHVTIVIIFAF